MKNKSLVIISFAFIFLLSMSIVSAGFFDWITGKAGADGGGGSCSGSGDNEYCNDISLESNCADPCTWTAGAIKRPEGCTIGAMCPIREGAGFAPVGADLQVAVKSVDFVTGVADVVVKDSRGNLQTVSVAADGSTTLRSGEVLKVGGIETRGGLFRRGAEVSITVTPASESGVGASVGGVAGAHTHLVDYEQLTQIFDRTNDLSNDNKVLQAQLVCSQGKVLLGGGYSLPGQTFDREKVSVLHNGFGPDRYEVSVTDPDQRISNLILYATCAREETAIGSGEPHF